MSKLYLGDKLIIDPDKKLEKVELTQAEYNALTEKKDNILYVITDAPNPYNKLVELEEYFNAHKLNEHIHVPIVSEPGQILSVDEHADPIWVDPATAHPEITEITFDELNNLKKTGTLLPGHNYKLTDTINVGCVLTALSTNAFKTHASGPEYPFRIFDTADGSINIYAYPVESSTTTDSVFNIPGWAQCVLANLSAGGNVGFSSWIGPSYGVYVTAKNVTTTDITLVFGEKDSHTEMPLISNIDKITIKPGEHIEFSVRNIGEVYYVHVAADVEELSATEVAAMF